MGRQRRSSWWGKNEGPDRTGGWERDLDGPMGRPYSLRAGMQCTKGHPKSRDRLGCLIRSGSAGICFPSHLGLRLPKHSTAYYENYSKKKMPEAISTSSAHLVSVVCNLSDQTTSPMTPNAEQQLKTLETS
ncbi:hypothetical protein V2G26_002542 [Clonostachys chloroleuca]